MFFLMVVLGIAVVLVGIAVIEGRRGSRGAGRSEDRHLNAQDKRGGSGWEFGSGAGG